jgi:predicted transcriptional regulator
MTTTQNTRRDNLHAVFFDIVHNWAVDVAEIAEHTDLTKDQVRSLLSTLERKGMVAGAHVNGEPTKIWQTYYDIQNETDVIERAEAEFAEKFPNEVADTKSPAQTPKTRPDEGQVIYEVKKTRTTGAHVTLTNYSKGTGERRYVAQCYTHSTVHEFAKRLPAEAMCHHPEEWCADCQVIDTTNQHAALQEQGI